MPEQPARYYYMGPRRVPLELVDDTVSVALTRPIPERRRAALETGRQPLDALARSPALMGRNILVHRTTPVARGAEGLQKLAARMVKAPSVRFVTHVFRHPETGLHMILTDEIAVRFKREVTPAEIAALNARHGVEIIEQKSYAPNQYLLRVQDPSPQRALDVANAYQESGLVEWAQPNFISETRLRFQAFQWHLNNTGQNTTGQGAGVIGEDVNAFAARALTEGRPEVVIAILDEGVDLTHPALVGNIAPGGRNFDDPARPNDPSPVGDGAHGTACAGVAAARGGRTDGVARQCRLLPVKMLNTTDDQMAEAIRFAALHADVLSNSWGKPGVPVIEQAILDVTATGREGRGTVVLFAIGNENAAIPAGDQSRIDGVIAVGSSTNVGSRSGYSNHGDAVDDRATGRKRISLVAPSDGTSANRPFWQASLPGAPTTGPFEEDNSTENIYTTDIQGPPGFNQPGFVGIPEPAPVAADQDYTGLFGGTSSACPLAAGICGLMLSIKRDLTRAQVKYLLEATSDKIGTGLPRVDVPVGRIPAGKAAQYNPVTGHDSLFGFGRVNAEQAVRAARGEPIRQFVRNGGAGAFQPAITVVLRRVPGTNHFVSDAEIEVVDARRDPETPVPAGDVRVFAAPTGFLRAAFQPAGGGPPLTDEVDVQGVMT